jgi:hypothetical protein
VPLKKIASFTARTPPGLAMALRAIRGSCSLSADHRGDRNAEQPRRMEPEVPEPT